MTEETRPPEEETTSLHEERLETLRQIRSLLSLVADGLHVMAMGYTGEFQLGKTRAQALQEETLRLEKDVARLEMLEDQRQVHARSYQQKGGQDV